MPKLTQKQKAALELIVKTPRKSGKFWRDLGVSPVTIAGLENRGMVGAVWRPATGETTILHRSWYATPEGIRALEQS